MDREGGRHVIWAETVNWRDRTLAVVIKAETTTSPVRFGCVPYSAPSACSEYTFTSFTASHSFPGNKILFDNCHFLFVSLDEWMERTWRFSSQDNASYKLTRESIKRRSKRGQSAPLIRVALNINSDKTLST